MIKKKSKSVGSRAEVYHGTAEKTSGGLSKKDLKKNKHGRIVSLKKSRTSKDPSKNPLLKLGLQQKKGSNNFGPLSKINKTKNHKYNSKKQKKRKSITDTIYDFFR